MPEKPSARTLVDAQTCAPTREHTSHIPPGARTDCAGTGIITRRRLVLGAGAGALLAGCAAPASVPAPAGEVASPQVRVGDLWRYAKIDRYRREQVGELTMQVLETTPRLRLRVQFNGGALDDEIHESPWRVLQDPIYGQTTVFRHPNPMLPNRLAAGESIKITNAWRPPGEQNWQLWTEWIDARGWERVTVPAGEFVALRITRRIAFDHPDFSRRGNQRQETLWYVPSINRWVQREWTGTFLWPGMRSSAPLNEDWITERLIEYRPG